jgi:glycosyltransferase involved in cell wall biosynthesis
MQWLRQCKETFDVIYIHAAFYYISLWLTGMNRKSVVVSSFYAALDDYIKVLANKGTYGRLKWLALVAATILGRVEKWAFYRSDAVVPRSIYSLDLLRQIYPKAYVPNPDDLIPLCIDTDLYKVRSRSDARAQMGLPADRPIFITVRRLDARMGLVNLIEATNTVRQKYPNVLVLMAGKGYLRPVLEASIEQHGLQENVRLLGMVSESDLPIYLASANMFVLPTENLEGFGLATIEALAVGIPVIGTPIGATPEILKPIDPNLLTADTTPAKLAERLLYWLDRQDQLDDLGKRCRQFAEQYYSSTRVAERLEHMFNDLVERRKLKS